MLILSRNKVKDGVLLSTYSTGYGIGCFLIERLRTDSLNIVPGVRASQILSLLLIGIGIAGLILINRNVLKTLTYEEKYLMKSRSMFIDRPKRLRRG